MKRIYAHVEWTALTITDNGFSKKLGNGLPGVLAGLSVKAVVNADYQIYCLYKEVEPGLFRFDKTATFANTDLTISSGHFEQILGFLDLTDRSEEDFNSDRLTNCFGFDASGYDSNGFDSWRTHRDTGTIYDPKGYNMNGFNKNGLNRRGYDSQDFNRKGIHKKTRTRFNPHGYDKNGLDINGDSEEIPF